MGNEKVLIVPGRYDQIQVICEFVSAGAREAGLDGDAVFHMELCCDEASTNIIEHAYGAEDVGEITVTYETIGDSFTVTLHDDGHPFDPGDVPEPTFPPSETNSDDAKLGGIMKSLKIGGLGIHFMRKLMDEVHFSFNGQQGNTLVLTKKIAPRSGA